MFDAKLISLLGLSLLLTINTACTGEKSSDSDEGDGDGDPDVTDETDEGEDTALENPPERPVAWMVFFGAFALKDGKATSFQADENGIKQTVKPGLAVIFANEDFQSSGSLDETCYMGFEADADLDAAAWVSSAEQAIFGLSTDQMTLIEEDCSPVPEDDYAGWDLSDVGGVDGLLENYVFGFALEAGVGDQVQAALEGAGAWEDLDGFVVGQGTYVETPSGAAYIDETGLTEAFEVDDAGEMLLDEDDEPVRIPADQVNATRAGIYLAQSLTLFEMAFLTE